MGAEHESCQKCEDRLRHLRSSHNDSMAMFGQNIKFVVEAIARSKRQFTHLPIGPLGSKIKLRDYNWATAVEQVLKRSLLCGFVVDNHRDADALRKIIRNVYEKNRGRQAGGKPEVIVSRFQSSVYDVGRNVSLLSKFLLFLKTENWLLSMLTEKFKLGMFCSTFYIWHGKILQHLARILEYITHTSDWDVEFTLSHM